MAGEENEDFDPTAEEDALVIDEGPSEEEWATIESRWDPRIMGVWNVRCRTVALVQILAFYEKADLYTTFMEWADKEGVRTLPA